MCSSNKTRKSACDTHARRGKSRSAHSPKRQNGPPDVCPGQLVTLAAVYGTLLLNMQTVRPALRHGMLLVRIDWQRVIDIEW